MKILGRTKQDYADCYSLISLTMDLFVIAKHSKTFPVADISGAALTYRELDKTYALSISGAFEQAFYLYPPATHGNLDLRMVRKDEVKNLCLDIIAYAMENTRGKAIPLDEFNLIYSREEILFTIKKAKHFCILHMQLAISLAGDKKGIKVT